jgi:hypothetical protein
MGWLCVGLFVLVVIAIIVMGISWSGGIDNSTPYPGSLDEYLDDPAGTPMSNMYKLGDWGDDD